MALEEGDDLPYFVLRGPDGREVDSASLLGGYLVLYFYPKDFTPGCTTEAREFSELAGQFEALGAKVVGVSGDDPQSHASFIERHGLKILLLSDPGGALAKELGAWGEKVLYGRRSTGPLRTTFLISPDGKVLKAWRSVRAKGHAKKVLEYLRSLAWQSMGSSDSRVDSS
jgi:peroxiredoxin Q/BCP